MPCGKRVGALLGGEDFWLLWFFFAYLYFLKRTAIPFTFYKRKVCAEVPISLRHTVSSELGGCGRPISRLVGLSANVVQLCGAHPLHVPTPALSAAAGEPWPWAAAGYKEPSREGLLPHLGREGS